MKTHYLIVLYYFLYYIILIHIHIHNIIINLTTYFKITYIILFMNNNIIIILNKYIIFTSRGNLFIKKIIQYFNCINFIILYRKVKCIIIISIIIYNCIR